jgi:hypothetical protein
MKCCEMEVGESQFNTFQVAPSVVLEEWGYPYPPKQHRRVRTPACKGIALSLRAESNGAMQSSFL